MRQLKVHLKLRGKALCGAKKQKRPLKYATDTAEATCGNCKRAIQQ